MMHKSAHRDLSDPLSRTKLMVPGTSYTKSERYRASAYILRTLRLSCQTFSSKGPLHSYVYGTQKTYLDATYLPWSGARNEHSGTKNGILLSIVMCADSVCTLDYIKHNVNYFLADQNLLNGIFVIPFYSYITVFDYFLIVY